MPSYHVQLVTPGGEQAQAALSAPSLPELCQRLQQQGYTPLKVVQRQADRSLRGYWRRVSEGELITLLRQFAVTLENGVAVPEALSLLAREAANPTLQAILLDVERSLREGNTLSSALSSYPRLFSPVHVRLLEAAEASSSLPEVLRQLADYAERAGMASQRIRTAMIYPQVVGVFTLALLTLAFTLVVPKFLELFRDLGVKELPFATQSLFWVSTVAVPGAVTFLPFAALAGWVVYNRNLRRAPFELAALRTRLPVLGVLYHHFALLRLTRLLAVLLKGGVPLLEALRLAGQGAESPLLQAAMWDAIPHIAAGETLASAFGHAGILPPTFCGQVAAAEKSGDLPGALERMADWYAGRVDFLSARAGALLEPFFIVILAAMAGWVAVGIFSPLLSIVQSLSGVQ